MKKPYEDNLDFDENNHIDLLKEAVYYFNLIPRKSGNKYTKDTYELASKIDKFLEKGEIYDPRSS